MRLLNFLNELDFKPAPDFTLGNPETKEINGKLAIYIRDFICGEKRFTFAANICNISKPDIWEFSFGDLKNGKVYLTSFQIRRYYDYLVRKRDDPKAKKDLDREEWIRSLQVWGCVLDTIRQFCKTPKLVITEFHISSGDDPMLSTIKREFGEKEAEKARSLGNFYTSPNFIKRVERNLKCVYKSNGTFVFKEKIEND